MDFSFPDLNLQLILPAPSKVLERRIVSCAPPKRPGIQVSTCAPHKPPTTAKTAKIATPAIPRANSLSISRANPDASRLTHVKTHTFTNLMTIGLFYSLTLHRENYFT